MNLSELEVKVNAELRQVENSMADSKSATAESYYARAHAESAGKAPRDRGSRGRGRAPRFSLRCWSCNQIGHLRRDCTSGSKESSRAGAFLVSAIVNTNMAAEYVEPVRHRSRKVPAGWEEQHMWLVDNGSEIHLSTVADDFEGKKLVFPAGYPLSIQTVTGKADIAGYARLTLIVYGTAGQPVFLDVMFAYVPMKRPCRLISMQCIEKTYLGVPTGHRVWSLQGDHRVRRVTLCNGASFDVRRGSRGGSGNSCLKVFTIARRAAKSDGATAKCSQVMGERTKRSGPAISNVKRATRSTQDIDNGDVATRSSRAMSNVKGATRSTQDIGNGDGATRSSRVISYVEGGTSGRVMATRLSELARP